MSERLVHQAIHGYDRGHRLLASSVKLPSGDAELLARLSDLSGALVPGLTFDAYLTFFPTGKFYAISRTWLDETAPRSGCVFTHTLLLSQSDWGAITCPRSVESLFQKPNRSVGFETFQRSISVNDAEPCQRNKFTIKLSLLNDFILKFFANGQYPLVWSDYEAAEDIAWSLFTFAWPSLRNWMAIGTFCLQPRSLSDSSFQIMFAPSAARARFHSLPKNAFVEGKAQLSTLRESWPQFVANALAHPEEKHPLSQVLSAIGKVLEPDPTLTRNLFLLQDLATRLHQSSTAGIALLDVLDSVVPNSGQAISLKSDMIKAAINSAAELQNDEALKALFLLNERLALKAFSEARSESSQALQNAVTTLAVSDLSAALVAVNSRHLLSHASDSSPFALGLLDALHHLANDETPTADQLLSLADFGDIGSAASIARPEIARGFLRVSRSKLANGSDIVAKWVANSPSFEDRESLRKALLPEITVDRDLGLARELLRDLSTSEVLPTLNTLFKSTNGFADTALRNLVTEQIAVPYSLEVRHWATAIDEWSMGAADVVSNAYDMNLSGFESLMKEWTPSNIKSPSVHACFIRRVLFSNRSGWFRDFAKYDCEFLFALLSLGQATPSTLVSYICEIFAECPEMPIARSHDLLPSVDRFLRAEGTQVIRDVVIMSAIREFVRNNIDARLMLSWHETGWSSDWLLTVGNSDVEDFLKRLIRNTDEWNRVWQWLAIVPRAFYKRPSYGVSDALRTVFLNRHSYWTEANANDWATVLRRSRELSEPPAHLLACAESLQYAFSHIWLPVSAVVVEAFEDVYNAVSNASFVPIEVSSLFGMRDWDKAKELRRALVASYYDSRVWPPGDLALATRDESLLRKVFRRLKRNWFGERYIRSMIEDLHSRPNDSASWALNSLLDFYNDPNFDEPWD